MATVSTPDYRTLLQDDTQWAQLVARLPADLEQSVFTCGAILRKRQVRAAAQLLRLLLAYACNLPLSVVVGWAAALGLAHLTDQALGQRIRHAEAWLRTLLTQMLAARAGLRAPLRLRVRLTDGTQVLRPGATGPDWRLHLTFDLQRMRLDALEITDAHQAEGLSRSAPGPGDLVVGDRNYGTRPNVLAAVLADAAVLVRIAWNNFPLLTRTAAPFDLFAALRTVPYDAIRAWDVCMQPARRQDPVVLGRLIASRLPAAEAAQARDRARKRQHKTAKTNAHGQKAHLQPETLEAAEYLIIFTTLPATSVTAAQVVALYRFRWQIELAIKRLKSLLGLAHLTARHRALCRSVLLAKLLLAVLVDDLCADAEAFFPSGRRVRSRGTAPRRLGALPPSLGDHPRLCAAWPHPRALD
jgi:hypothetical protein